MTRPFTTPLDKRWIQIVFKAWTDEKFKQQLLADPAAVMKANGIPVPAGIAVKAVENTDKTVFVTLPTKPHGITKDELDKVTPTAFGWLDDVLGSISRIGQAAGPLLGAFGI